VTRSGPLGSDPTVDRDRGGERAHRVGFPASRRRVCALEKVADDVQGLPGEEGDADEEQSDKVETFLWSTSSVVARNNEGERPKMTRHRRDPVELVLDSLVERNIVVGVREMRGDKVIRRGPKIGGAVPRG
jgi:hypothetical protein